MTDMPEIQQVIHKLCEVLRDHYKVGFSVGLNKDGHNKLDIILWSHINNIYKDINDLDAILDMYGFEPMFNRKSNIQADDIIKFTANITVIDTSKTLALLMLIKE